MSAFTRENILQFATLMGELGYEGSVDRNPDSTFSWRHTKNNNSVTIFPKEASITITQEELSRIPVHSYEDTPHSNRGVYDLMHRIRAVFPWRQLESQFDVLQQNHQYKYSINPLSQIQIKIMQTFFRGLVDNSFRKTLGEAFAPKNKKELRDAITACAGHRREAFEKYSRVETWVTTRVTDMSSLFEGIHINSTQHKNWDEWNAYRTFDISTWDVSNVTTMEGMFRNCGHFDKVFPDKCLANWKPSKVENMREMFKGTSISSANLGAWDISAVTTAEGMFSECTKFTGQGLENWKPSKAENMRKMFDRCLSFNADLGGWDISAATTTEGMFSECTKFTGQGLENWKPSKVENMHKMLDRCVSFNADLGGWGNNTLTNVADAGYMFRGCGIFTGKGVETWRMTNALQMDGMFSGCRAFDADLGEWNVSAAKFIDEMFMGCHKFLGHGLENWRPVNVETTSSMFHACVRFNADLGAWNMPKLWNMEKMFYACREFTGQGLERWVLNNPPADPNVPNKFSVMMDGVLHQTGIPLEARFRFPWYKGPYEDPPRAPTAEELWNEGPRDITSDPTEQQEQRMKRIINEWPSVTVPVFSGSLVITEETKGFDPLESREIGLLKFLRNNKKEYEDNGDYYELDEGEKPIAFYYADTSTWNLTTNLRLMQARNAETVVSMCGKKNRKPIYTGLYLRTNAVFVAPQRVFELAHINHILNARGSAAYIASDLDITTVPRADLKQVASLSVIHGVLNSSIGAAHCQTGALVMNLEMLPLGVGNLPPSSSSSSSSSSLLLSLSSREISSSQSASPSLSSQSASPSPSPPRPVRVPSPPQPVLVPSAVPNYRRPFRINQDNEPHSPAIRSRQLFADGATEVDDADQPPRRRPRTEDPPPPDRGSFEGGTRQRTSTHKHTSECPMCGKHTRRHRRHKRRVTRRSTYQKRRTTRRRRR